MAKITIIGSGNVGATAAQRIIEKNIADVVLIDILEGVPQGKALDLAQAAAIEGHSRKIIGTNDYADTKDSDIIIITAGIARKPGMSRDDLLKINAGIVKEVTQKASQESPNAIIIIVSNPLDAMCHVALKTSGFAKHKVIGMAGILDSARFKEQIARKLNTSIENVEAMVLGGHGDTMVPLPRYATISGIQIQDLLSKEEIEIMITKTRNGGAEIVSLLKTGSAYYAPASAAAEMAESIIRNQKKVLPCAALLSGQYGISDLFIGVPIKLGKNGVEEIIELKLSTDEKKALEHSANAVKELLNAMK